MINPRILKERPQAVRDMLKKRNMEDFPLDHRIMMHKRQPDVAHLRRSEAPGRKRMCYLKALQRRGIPKQDASPELTEMKQVSTLLGRTEAEGIQVEERSRSCSSTLPNLLDDGVPVGRRREGQCSFAPER